MPKATYPDAIFADNGISGGSYTGGPAKLVIHTTETSGMPGYNGGASAPHVTYDPRSRIFVQHRPFTSAARALRNESGGVQTNRDMALQIEIICYSQKSVADQQTYRDWVGDLVNIPGALDDLRKFITWVCDEWGVQRSYPNKAALSYTAANKSGFRMSNTEWDNYNGVCGHQHVPENTHWDPGAFPWELIMEGEDMPTAEEIAQAVWNVRARTGDSSVWMQLDRNYRNIAELVIAHRAGQLGANAKLDDEDIATLVDVIVGAGIAKSVADELAKRIAN